MPGAAAERWSSNSSTRPQLSGRVPVPESGLSPAVFAALAPGNGSARVAVFGGIRVAARALLSFGANGAAALRPVSGRLTHRTVHCGAVMRPPLTVQALRAQLRLRPARYLLRGASAPSSLAGPRLPPHTSALLSGCRGARLGADYSRARRSSWRSRLSARNTAPNAADNSNALDLIARQHWPQR
jgi:hypothetical protein